MADFGSELSLAVGQLISELRQQKGWSVEVLADKADLHRTSVGLIERGRRGVTVAVAARIAVALNVRLSDLVRNAEQRLDSPDER